MKKVLVIFAMAMVTMTAKAQVEFLDRHVLKGDPLLGTKDCTAFYCKNLTITEKDDNATFTLNNKETSHIFISGAVLIGYYNNNNDFLYKTEAYITKYNIEQGSQREWFTVAFSKDSVPYSKYSEKEYILPKMWRVRGSDILRWLRENDGYIRIVAPMYGGNKLDLKIAIKKEE